MAEDAETIGVQVKQKGRTLGRLQPCENRLGRRLKTFLIAGESRKLQWLFRHVNLDVRDVRRQFEVDRKLAAPCRENQPVDLQDSIFRRKFSLGGRHFRECSIEIASTAVG